MEGNQRRHPLEEETKFLSARRHKTLMVEPNGENPNDVDLSVDKIYYQLEKDWWIHVDTSTGPWLNSQSRQAAGNAQLPLVLVQMRVMNDGRMNEKDIRSATTPSKRATLSIAAVTDDVRKAVLSGRGPRYMDKGLYITPGQFLDLVNRRAQQMDKKVMQRNLQGYNDTVMIALPLSVGDFDMNQSTGYGKYLVYDYSSSEGQTRYQIRTGKINEENGQLIVGSDMDCFDMSPVGWEMLKRRFPMLRLELESKMIKQPDWPPPRNTWPRKWVEAAEEALVVVLENIFRDDEPPIVNINPGSQDPNQRRRQLIDYVTEHYTLTDLREKLRNKISTIQMPQIQDISDEQALYNLVLQAVGLKQTGGGYLTKKIMYELASRIEMLHS